MKVIFSVKFQTSCDSAKVLMQLSHIRLDREQLAKIDSLDCLGPVTNLYLQHVSYN